MNKILNIRLSWNLKSVPCQSLRGTFYELLMENLDNPTLYLLRKYYEQARNDKLYICKNIIIEYNI